jgi:DNA-binding beta-propeller fold protein YncE
VARAGDGESAACRHLGRVQALMNTRTAVATLAFAVLNLTAIALQDEDDPVPFVAGELIVVSAGSDALSAFDAEGVALPQPLTGLTAPEDLLFAPDGTLFIADGGSDLVLIVHAGGGLLDTVGAGSGLSSPTGLALGPDGALYVGSSGTDSVLVYDRAGTLVQEVGEFDGLSQPWGLAFGPDGRLYVASTGTNTVLAFDPSGTLVGELDGGGALNVPLGLCFDGAGNLWVASSGNNLVVAMHMDGAVVATFDGGGALDMPTGLAFGPDGLLYVSCTGSDRVVALDGTDTVVKILGEDGGMTVPRGLAFAPHLFNATLKGVLQIPGLEPQKFTAKAMLASTPGRPEIGVRLLDPEGALAAAWDSDTWMLRGFLSQESAIAKVRSFGGEQVGGGAAHAGLVTLQLDLKGKLDKPDDITQPLRFLLKSAGGSFQRSGPEGIATGKLKTGSAIKP